jgi:hypothetical protein
MELYCRSLLSKSHQVEKATTSTSTFLRVKVEELAGYFAKSVG